MIISIISLKEKHLFTAFGIYLKEECYIVLNLQFLFKYFVNKSFDLKLLPKVTKVQTTFFKAKSERDCVNDGISWVFPAVSL